jgi:hypothetical protein
MEQLTDLPDKKPFVSGNRHSFEGCVCASLTRCNPAEGALVMPEAIFRGPVKS